MRILASIAVLARSLAPWMLPRRSNSTYIFYEKTVAAIAAAVFLLSARMFSPRGVNTSFRKEVCTMSDEQKKMPQQPTKDEPKRWPENKHHIKPSSIKGKIEVTDTRERRDGPGGN
jgi:hypothetical protein